MKVKGNIIDSFGEPVMGANVYPNGIKGVGAISDFDGNFEIDSEEITEDDIITISYIGYTTKSSPAYELNGATVVLRESIEPLDEVIVYGSLNKPKTTEQLTVINTIGDVKKNILKNPYLYGGVGVLVLLGIAIKYKAFK